MPALSTYSYLDGADNATVLEIKRLAGTQSVINVKTDCGAIADGASHKLSSRYASLAAAQVDYPFATSLANQEIDYCACKLGSNLAFGGDLELLTAYLDVTANTSSSVITDSTQSWTTDEHAGKTAFRKFISNGFVDSAPILSNTATTLTLSASLSTGDPVSFDDGNQYAIGYGEHGSISHLNKRLYLPTGKYQFGDDTWTISNLASGVIEGDGRSATAIYGDEAVLKFDGIWYSELANFSAIKQTTSTTNGQAAIELDGNVPGHAYDTRGVQGVTLRNILMDGGAGPHALSMCRQGGSGGQGSECSFINCHWQNASFACYYQNGFNALANTFWGGNVQNYTQNGIYVTGGTIAVIGTGFQSTTGYKQIENDGWDINVGSAGAYEGCLVYGCRSESLRFLNNDGGVSVDIRGCAQNMATTGWFASTAYGAAAALYKAIVVDARLFVATTEGTSGGSSPDFAAVASGGTVADNTIVWTHVPFNVIRNTNGSVDSFAMRVTAGTIFAKSKEIQRTIDTSQTLFVYDETVFVDCASGPLTITLSPDSVNGQKVTIKKTDTSANALTITSTIPNQFEGTSQSSVTIPGGSRGYKILIAGSDEVGNPLRWHVVAEGTIDGVETRTAYVVNSSNVNAQTGTTYTLVAADNGKTVTLSNGSAITLTVPASLGAGFSCTLIQIGAGQVTLSASGTTINPSGTLKIAAQHGKVEMYAYAANTFNLSPASALTA